MDSIWDRIWEYILRALWKFLIYVVLILLVLMFAMLKYGCVRCIRYCRRDLKQEEGAAGELEAPDYIVPPIPMPWHKHWHDAEAARGAPPRAFSDTDILLLKPLHPTGDASVLTPLITRATGTSYPSCQAVVLPPEGAGYPSAPSAPDANDNYGKLLVALLVVGGALFLIISCCVRCILYCRRKQEQESRAAARVLATPPALDAPPHAAPAAPPAPAPYSQQQYAAPYPGTTYPNSSYQPAVLSPEGAGYVQGVAPVAGYPPPGASAAPYPTYPSASNAPDANMMPPSYEQAVCAKPPPHNPYASH